MKYLLSLWKHLPIVKSVRLFLLRRINDHFLVGVTGVIFNHKNQVLIVKHTYRKVAWSLPGGYLQANEHPKLGLEREIFEETGFLVHIIRIITTKTDHQGRLDMSYFGEYVSGEFKKSQEVSHYRFVPLHKLPPLIDGQLEQILEGLKRKKNHDRQQRWHRMKKRFSHFYKTLTHPTFFSGKIKT